MSGLNNRRCKRCILPENFPGARLDEEDICAYCRALPTPEELKESRVQAKDQIEHLLNNVRGKETYDAIVAFSGGKDSSYLLWMLSHQYNLNVLAVTIDNGFLSRGAFENCRKVVETLNVDHIFFKPASKFMKSLYSESYKGGIHIRAAATRASEICNSCIKLINTEMIRTAMRHKVKVIAGGYIGGQVPKDGSIMEINLASMAQTEGHMMGKFIERFGPEAARFMSIRSLMNEDAEGEIYVINPLLTIEYSEAELYDKLSKIGWVRPNDTGAHSSNCRINDLGIISHIRNYGFHPYLAELADQVRWGSLSREEALRRVNEEPEWESVQDVAEKLGIDKPVKNG